MWVWVLNICQNYAFVFVNMSWSLYEKIKYQSQNKQNKRRGETTGHIFETYKNAVRPHGCNIHNISSVMTVYTLFTFPYSHHVLPLWKCVLCCCEKCPRIVIPGQASNVNTTNTCPKILFYVYRNLSCCTFNDIYP